MTDPFDPEPSPPRYSWFEDLRSVAKYPLGHTPEAFETTPCHGTPQKPMFSCP